MTWELVSTETTRAPRALTRATASPDVVDTFLGPVDRTPRPDVGGRDAEMTHEHWRCRVCRASTVRKKPDLPQNLPACAHPAIKRNSRR